MEFDFEKNPTVETIDVVPEKYRGLYTEVTEGDNAGQFALTDAAKGLVTDYSGLARTAAGLRQEKKTASDESAKRRHELKIIGDTLTSLGIEIGEEGPVPALEAAWRNLQDQIKGGKSMQVDLDKIKQQFAQQKAELESENQKSQDGMLTTLTKHMVVGDATAAIAEAKGSVALLLPLVRDKAVVVPDENGEYVVRIKDPDGTFRLDAAGNPLSIKGLVAEMKTQPEYARAFESEAKGGTGVVPGSTARPAQAQRQAQGGSEMSAVDKIKAGLKKGQARSGHGAGVI